MKGRAWIASSCHIQRSWTAQHKTTGIALQAEHQAWHAYLFFWSSIVKLQPHHSRHSRSSSPWTVSSLLTSSVYSYRKPGSPQNCFRPSVRNQFQSFCDARIQHSLRQLTFQLMHQIVTAVKECPRALTSTFLRLVSFLVIGSPRFLGMSLIVSNSLLVHRENALDCPLSMGCTTSTSLIYPWTRRSPTLSIADSKVQPWSTCSRLYLSHRRCTTLFWALARIPEVPLLHFTALVSKNANGAHSCWVGDGSCYSRWFRSSPTAAWRAERHEGLGVPELATLTATTIRSGQVESSQTTSSYNARTRPTHQQVIHHHRLGIPNLSACSLHPH